MIRLNGLKIFSLSLLMVGLAACTSDTEETETINETGYQGNMTSEQSNELVAAYLEIKDALVNDDVEGTKKGAQNVMNSMKEMSMDETLESIHQNAQAISEADEIDVQREHFKILSEKIYTVAKSIPSGIVLYKEYCPMAFDNEGAYWVSQEEEIYNPYFGSAMLHCGSVKETIASE